MSDTSAPRLYGITDSQLMAGEKLIEKAEAALAGGCGWLQYRDKSTDRERRQEEAQALLALCNNYDARLIINDDVELAAATGAHGVHLGQEDTSAANAREHLGSSAIIGVTCHADLSLAHRAQADGASYVAFGRFFTSSTKPGASPAPLHILAQARTELDLPIVAIGGINLHNAAAVLSAGATTLAVCGSLFDCDNPRARAQAFLALQFRPLATYPSDVSKYQGD